VTNLNHDMLNKILRVQKSEITEYHIYSDLAASTKDENNRRVLQEIAKDELRHYHFWQQQTGQEVLPDRWKVFKYKWIARLLGLTFGIKLMEKGEEHAKTNYEAIAVSVPQAEEIAREEEVHEQELIGLIEEERLNYVGSMVLGLNDALVELTGTLAGLSFALQKTRLIAMAGLITGIAASFSMAASEYLSTKSEGEAGKKALKSSLYTGVAYIITVILLILPYFIFKSYIVSLFATLCCAILIICGFNFYISVAKNMSFRKRFLEMSGISLGVSALSFVIGYLVRTVLGVEV